MKKRIKTVWEVWSYDVWGNANDGYDVNDRFKNHEGYEINILFGIANKSTPQEFRYASPSDYAIKKALGIKKWIHIETDGDDINIYVNAIKDGYPLGELHCISHKSLSPIRE